MAGHYLGNLINWQPSISGEDQMEAMKMRREGALFPFGIKSAMLPS